MENSQRHYTRNEPDKSNQSFASGLIIRQKEPNNLETLFDQIESFITPTETTGPRLTSDFRSHLEFQRRFD